MRRLELLDQYVKENVFNVNVNKNRIKIPKDVRLKLKINKRAKMKLDIKRHNKGIVVACKTTEQGPDFKKYVKY